MLLIPFAYKPGRFSRPVGVVGCILLVHIQLQPPMVHYRRQARGTSAGDEDVGMARVQDVVVVAVRSLPQRTPDSAANMDRLHGRGS
jgi:hypothetical protein